MKSEKAASKLSIKTCDLMSSGGGHDVIRAGDLQAVLAAINPTPLMHDYYYAKYQLAPIEPFENKLVFWLYNKLLESKRIISLDYIAKAHKSHLNASYELSEGLASYLCRNKIKNESLSPHFKPINKSTFSRQYKEFIQDCVVSLESELGVIERKIHEMTKD